MIPLASAIVEPIAKITFIFSLKIWFDIFPRVEDICENNDTSCWDYGSAEWIKKQKMNQGMQEACDNQQQHFPGFYPHIFWVQASVH